jgi:citrate synthase
MKSNVLTARQVARRLGVKLATVYAYVSRGVLDRTLADDGRTSRFDSVQVDRLARSGRPRKDTPRLGTVDVSMATSITEIHDDRLLFRGHDATGLARKSTFESVAELLWTGALPEAAMWLAPTRGVRVARAATAALPSATTPIERFAVITSAMACAHPLRLDLRAAAVVAHGRALIATFVQLLPRVGAGRSRPAPALRVAARLWTRLSPLAYSAERVAVIDAALVLLSDHELATSTLAARVAASTRADPFGVVLAGLGAVSGPLHGKAARGAHRLFLRASSSSPEVAVAHALAGGDGAWAFGHPVYRGIDPRAAYLFEALLPLLDRSDRRLLETVQWVASRSGAAPPNVDFTLGALAFGLKMPVGATEAIFVIARTSGWIAHALEEYGESPLRFRARAIYIGPETPREQRGTA